MLEYGPDQIKIVDFLLLANFWACLLFFPHPLLIKYRRIRNLCSLSVIV